MPLHIAGRPITPGVAAAALAAAAVAGVGLAVGTRWYLRRRRLKQAAAAAAAAAATIHRPRRNSARMRAYSTSGDELKATLRRSSTLAGMLDAQPSPKTSFHNRFLGTESSGTRTFRILSLDGGGTRGTFSARILQRLCHACPTLLDNVDIIAGTSTGSLLAVLLSLGYDADETFEIFNTAAPKIFEQPPWWRRYNPALAKYSGLAKQKIFERISGKDTKLSDLERYIMVMVFSMEYSTDAQRREVFYGQSNRWHPGVFTNLPQRDSRVPTDGDAKVVDVAMCATAAPTFFPIHQGFIDGGVFANNPSLCAVARLLDSFPDSANTENIKVLSIGTGASPSRMSCNAENAPLGLLDWLPHILPLMNDSSQDAVNFNMSMILGDRYHRVDDYLPRMVSLDDASREGMGEMIVAADSVDLTATIEWVNKHFVEAAPHRVSSDTDLSASGSMRLTNTFGATSAGSSGTSRAESELRLDSTATEVRLPSASELPDLERHFRTVSNSSDAAQSVPVASRGGSHSEMPAASVTKLAKFTTAADADDDEEEEEEEDTEMPDEEDDLQTPGGVFDVPPSEKVKRG